MATEVGTLRVKLKADVRGFSSNMKSAFAPIRSMKAEVKSLGVGIIALSAGLAGLGAGILTATRGFGRGMSRAGAVTQATTKELSEMKSTALSVAGSTEFTAREIANAMAELGVAGLSASESMQAIAKSANLASAAQRGVAESAQIGLAVMNAQQFGVDQLVRVNDVLASGFTGSANTLETLGEALKTSAPIAVQAGIGFEDLAAVLAKLGDVGIQGTEAGTGLKRSIANLLNPTKQQTKALEKLGLTALFAATDGFPSFIEIVEAMEDASKNVGNRMQTTALIMQAFGQFGGPKMAALLGVGSEALEEMKDRLENAGGTAKRIATAQLNNLDGALKILNSQVETLSISLGDALTPAIRDIADGISGAVGWFQKLNPELKKTIAETGLMVVGLGAATTAFGGLMLLLGPIVKIMAAAASSMVAVLVTATKGVVKLALTIGTSISAPLIVTLVAIAAVIAAAGAMKQAWDANLFGIRDAITKTVDWVREKVDFLFDKVSEIKTNVIKNLLFAFGNVLPDHVTARMKAMVDVEITKKEKEAVKKQETVIEKIKNGLGILGEGVKQGFKDLFGSFKSGVALIGDGIKGITGLDSLSIGGIADKIKAGIGEEKFAKLRSMLDQAGIALKDFIKAIKNGSVGVGKAGGGEGKPGDGATQTKIPPKNNEKDPDFANPLEDLIPKFKTFVDDEGKSREDFQGGDILGTIENLKGVIDSVSQAMSAGLGPLGIILAVLVKLIQDSKQFETVINFLGDVLQSIADTVGLTLEPMRGIFGGVKAIVNAVIAPLAPLFKAVGEVIRPLSPILMQVAAFIKIVLIVLQPVIFYLEILGKVIEVISRVIFSVISAVLFVIGWIIKGIASVWNAILSAIAAVFDALGSINVKIFGKNVGLGFLKDWAKSIRSAKINTDALSESLDQLKDGIDPTNNNFDELQNEAEMLGPEFEELGKTARDVSEELKNVPDGFKVAIARFNAMNERDHRTSSGNFATLSGMVGGVSQRDETGGNSAGLAPLQVEVPMLASGGIVTRPTLAVIGEERPEVVKPLDDPEFSGGGAGAGSIVIQHMTVVADSVEDFERDMRRRAQLRFGVAGSTAPIFTGS